VKTILSLVALVLFAVAPASACDAYSVVTPSVSVSSVYGYYAPPAFSVGYIAAPLPLVAPVVAGYSAYSAPVVAAYSAPVVVRQRVVFRRGLSIRIR
jgi:hypothetical protein